MSLWTPSGEHQVPRPTPAPNSSRPDTDDDGWRERLARGELGLDDLTPEQRAEVEAVIDQMAETQQQLLETPVSEFIVQHYAGLRELAILHLQNSHPDLASAKIVINAMAGLVEAVIADLEEMGPALKQDLVSVQMAFVEVQGGST